ncbi:MAG: hypothetical protein NT016_02815 [Candidatus Aenigmarchaeota archaeon]|nr:hypothetical protein [Candidatus Aenigmarchaeota archaeon]
MGAAAGRLDAFMSGLGISPLAAAVILIAVTMTVSGVLAYWATNFVNAPSGAAATESCGAADFLIYYCNFDSSSSNLNSNLNIILENLKSVELNDLRVYLVYQDSTVSNALPLGSSLSGGVLKSYTVTGVASSFAKIVVKTQCPELTREAVCSRTTG